MLDEGQFASSSGRCEAGDQVIIDYVGRLKENDYEFDRSNGPFTFTLGYGEVIAGMERGVLGMKTDETRRVTVPPKLDTAREAIHRTFRATRRSCST